MNNNEAVDNFLDILCSVDLKLFNPEFLKIFLDFKNLSREKQIELFSLFLDYLNHYKLLQEQEEYSTKCENNDHIYSSWYENSSFKGYHGSTFKNRFWCKKCVICGKKELSYTMPKEVIYEQSIHKDIKLKRNIKKR